MRVVFTLVIAIACAAGTLLAQGQGIGVTAIQRVRVIVGDGRPPIENATVIVQNGRITQVGTNVQPPAGATTIVAQADQTLMPTIVDTHTHLSQDRAALEQDLRRRAQWGVSAAISMGQDTERAPFEVRAQPLPGAARFFTAGRGITRPEPGRSMAPIWVNTAAEARKAVQDNVAQKVDLIKIWVDDRNGMYPKLTPELYGAVIDEAHMRGLRVAAHIFTLDDAKGLLKAGLDAFAHGVRDRDIDDEFLAMWKARPNTVLIPNLPDRGVRQDYAWLRGSMSAEELMKLEMGNTDRPAAQETFGIQARNLKKLADAGARITVGTDGNTPYAPHIEMADMVASGMTPMQVITAATRNGAEFLRMTDSGTIETGKSADFLIVNGNPAQDITNTRRISAVYLRGTAVQR